MDIEVLTFPHAAPPAPREIARIGPDHVVVTGDLTNLALEGEYELAREVLGRLRTSERLRAHVAALVRHHLRLGFLVHEPQPLSRRSAFDFDCGRSTGEIR